MRNALALCALLAGACGGSGVSDVDQPGTAQVSGKLGGAPFSPKSVIAVYDATSIAAEIVMYEADGACAEPSSTASTTGRVLGLDVDDMNADGVGPPVAGAYPIAADPGVGRTAFASFDVDAAHGVGASSGTIDITHNEGAGLRGVFDLSFTDGSKISGSFDALLCTNLAHGP